MSNVRSMWDEECGDPRLLGIAYIEFWVRGDRGSLRLMRRGGVRSLARSVGLTVMQIIELLYLPAVHHLSWEEPWVVVDQRRRCEPALDEALRRRATTLWMLRYGTTLSPRRSLNVLTAEAAELLWDTYAASSPAGDGWGSVTALLTGMRESLVRHSGDAIGNA